MNAPIDEGPDSGHGNGQTRGTTTEDATEDAREPSPPRLRVEPHGWTMDAAPPLSLLEAAQQAGVRLARSCRNGTCRNCLCRLVSGAVSYRIEWPGLSAEEKAEGWILPCVALAKGDVVIDAPSAIRTTG